MSLTLYMHPLASFCQKVLVALYENETPFENKLVDLGNPTERDAFIELWPVGKFPLLHDKERGRKIPESTIIIEYLARYYPGRTELLPADPDRALQTRLQDRFFDLYVNELVQKIVTDKIRPEGSRDRYGVEHARRSLMTSYGILERELATKTWAIGDTFTMADCAASPALFYANLVLPIGDAHPNLAAYHARLMARPSFVRTREEARPYFHLFPGG